MKPCKTYQTACLRSFFYLEGSEAAEVDVFVLGHVGLHSFHQGFDGFFYYAFFNTRFFRDFRLLIPPWSLLAVLKLFYQM
jgi:hypothetical protein